MSGNSLSRGQPRPQPDATSPSKPDFYKNCAAASAKGHLNMSGNSFSRGNPRPQPDATSPQKPDSYKHWATASAEGLLNMSGNSFSRGVPPTSAWCHESLQIRFL